MHKRKHRKSKRDDDFEQSARTTENLDALAPDPCLYIQAHEADVIRGPSAVPARFLECQDPSIALTSSQGTDAGTGLIRWGPPGRPGDADVIDIQQPNEPVLWVDRYDVRLLLDRLSDFPSESTQVRSLSPSGWSDLPSDSEDTFFFSPDELEDYRREKRRRLIDRNREERLKALAAVDGQQEDSDPWGSSDEEPDSAQRELICRTAAHIISSPNPGQLEMRILANYGTDKRFAFLRGRWSRVWRMEKERVRQNLVEEAKKNQMPTAPASLGGVIGYGDSDTDESVGNPTEEPEGATESPTTQDGPSSEDAVKEARRARAREWSLRRRVERSEPHPEQV